MAENKNISAFTQDEIKKFAENNQLIDVRTPEEHAEDHIPGSILHTLDEIESFDLPNDRHYYIYCRSGNRSAQAADILETMNYKATNLDGGILAYNDGKE